MPASMRMEIRSNKLPDLTPKMNQMLGMVVRKCAFDMQADAQARTPVDTGALRNSIHTVTLNADGYEAARAAVLAANPAAKMFPNVPVTLIMTAKVAVGVQYGAFVEFGTVRMSARPYFTPAVDRIRPIFVKRCAEAVRLAAAGGTATDTTTGGTP